MLISSKSFLRCFMFDFVCFLDSLTEEEEERVADAVNRFVGEFVGRGVSPDPDDILRFSDSARIMMRYSRVAPKPEQKTGH